MITHTTILGFQIAEPTTAITDFILALLCLFFYFRVAKNPIDRGINNWRLFFLFMSVSTFLGGISHAFLENHQSVIYLTFWLSMQLFSGLSIYFAQLATIRSIPNAKIPLYSSEQISMLICRIQFVIFAALVLIFQNFLVVVINSTLGFLMVLYIHAISGKKYGNRPAGWIAAGITISFLTAIVYSLKISVNAWFNFKDLAHVIMMVSICFIFYGVGLYLETEKKEKQQNPIQR